MQNRGRVIAGAAAAAVIAGGAIAVAASSGTGSKAVLLQAAPTPRGSGTGSKAVLLQAAPTPGGSAPATSGFEASVRALDGMPAMACGGISDLGRLSATPGVENADTPEAAGLRGVFAHDPSGGEAPQTPHGWVLMAEKDGVVTFGQREGVVGIGATVELKQSGSGYVPSGSGGCGPVGYADGQQTMDLGDYEDEGAALQVDYEGDSCDQRQPAVRVTETSTAVYVLAATQKPTADSTRLCAGTGLASHLTVRLSRPLGGRAVIDVGYDPGRILQTAAQDEAAAKLQAARDAAAQKLCDGLAAQQDEMVTTVYDTDVATVRADVKAAATAWSALPAAQPAADCFLGQKSSINTPPPGGTLEVVDVTAGAAPVVRDKNHPDAGLMEQLTPLPGASPQD